MKTISCVFVAVCLINISIVAGQIISPKKCDELGLPPMQNFRKERQMGLWYMQEVYPWPQAENADCYTVTYVPVGDTVVVTDTYQDLDHKLEASIPAVATYDSSGNGVYRYVSTDNSGFDGRISVLSDYTNYSVEVFCTDAGDHSETFYYVLTRSRSVPTTIQQKIDKVFADNNIDKTIMRKIKQDVNTCVYGLSGGLGGLLGRLVGLVTGLLTGLLG